MRLVGKVALVTSGTSGIGRAYVHGTTPVVDGGRVAR